MKKLLTLLAIFMTMVCGSALLVSCSNDYKKMRLVVEYALPAEGDGDVEWNSVPSGKGLDYYLSDDVYVDSDMSHVLWLRVKVKGTSKKVSSLYVSQSATTSTILQSNTVKPNEPFKVLVKNIGSVRFTITPSQGGENKRVSFGVNIYKQITGIAQNAECVPAVVTGGYIELGKLNNLIQYKPLGETNQTGVDFTLNGIGTLIEDDSNNLIAREFSESADYNVNSEKTLIKHNDNNVEDEISLDISTGRLLLKVSDKYGLTKANNVIWLQAKSRYYDQINASDEYKQENLICDVYVYIVENCTPSSLLVSYSDNVELDSYTGKLPTDVKLTKPVGDNVVLYNSIVVGDSNFEYNAINMYTYTNPSIYSYESNPGIKLNVYINGTEYDYTDIADNDFGIEVSPLYKTEGGVDKLIGLKFAVNPNSTSDTNVYNVRMELDFNAFDFSASDKAPVSVLNKTFTITVESLASGFNINGKGYQDNLTQLENGELSTITGYGTNQLAKLYTSYSASSVGMQLNIQATPTNAINTSVKVGFYGDIPTIEDGKIKTSNNLASSNLIELRESLGSGMEVDNKGKFEIDFANKNKIVYLRFGEQATPSNIEALNGKLYMVCEVVCTPDSFGLDGSVEQKYMTFVARIDIVGAADQVYVYKNEEEEKEENTLTDKYLKANVSNKAYINFTSNTVPDLREIRINSKHNNIKYSANGVDWSTSIMASELAVVSQSNLNRILYFKTDSECEDVLIITSPNGVGTQIKYEFVNTVSDINEVKVKPDEQTTYIKDFEYSTDLEYEYETGKKVDTTLKYLALQSGKTVQFMASGDDRYDTINNVSASSLMVTSDEYSKIFKDNKKYYYNTSTEFNKTYSASAIRVSNVGDYIFDISANSVGFTAILFVRVDFFVEVDEVVQPQSKYFVYEVAVYTPAKDLQVVTDKESIVYINKNEASTVNFTISLNRATKMLAFSDGTLNSKINLEYAGGGLTSIYGINVEKDDTKWSNDYFEISGLNNFEWTQGVTYKKNFVKNSTSFSIKALKSLLPLQEQGVQALSFDIAIYQFGEMVETTKVTKVVYLGNYNKSKSIAIESGVESYDNIYLSLIKGSDTRNVIAYATNENDDVTYKDLGFNLHKLASDGSLLPCPENHLSIDPNQASNTFVITADEFSGGVYQLEFYAKDSYDADERVYKVTHKIKITVSDGKTDATAYLIKDVTGFEALATGTKDNYYRLWQDIDVSSLGIRYENGEAESNGNWWEKTRDFAGTLDGAMTIEDLNTGKTIYRRYSLMNLRLTSMARTPGADANLFGLFNYVSGTIKNVVFDRTEIGIVLDGNNTSSNTPVDIGVITAVNNGTIENCSVNIVNSNITFDTSAQNTTYNIGLVAGLNNSSISYDNTNSGSNYSHIVDVSSIGNTPGKLSITVEKGNANFGANTDINIGGVAGQNATDATVKADYVDGSSKSVNELINAVVNIEVSAEYDASNSPMDINSINVGGIVGWNAGRVNNISASGSIIANDKVNIGGIVGQNAGIIQEVANYGAHIEGNVYEPNYATINGETLKYHGYNKDVDTDKINQEQNIGGIVGVNNAGIVDNVRVMFLYFANDEVAIASSSALIKGVGNVAGIIGKANDTQLTRAYVENFVADVDNNNLNYNIIGINANVAGLIAESTSSEALLSFVQADFDVQNCDFYEFGEGLTYSYVYFIGDVLTDVNSNKVEVDDDGVPTKLISHNDITAGKSYIINNLVYNNLVYNKVLKNIVTYGLAQITNLDTTEIDKFIIQWHQSDEEGVNNNQPYLVYIVDGKVCYTLTVQPTDIIVNFDEKYFDEDASETKSNRFEIYDDGIYLQYVDNNSTPDVDTDDETVATAIVYYIEGANNTHQLVSTDNKKGLIEKTVLPNISAVNSSYAVSIVSGSTTVASLTDGGSTITFKGTGKVELRFTSLFDRKIYDEVTIFVENPLHDDVFKVTSGAGLEDRTETGEMFTTMVGVNSLLTLSLLKVDEQQAFDAAKTYMVAQYSSGTAKINGVEETVENVDQYFAINALTDKLAGGNALGQFSVSALDLEKSWSYLEIPVKLRVYLNLDKYYLGDSKLSDLMGSINVLLEEKTITIKISNKATDLNIVSGDTRAQAGEDIDVISILKTGYIDESKPGSTIQGEIAGINKEKLILNEITTFDKIYAILTVAEGNKNAQDLLNKAISESESPEEFSIWDLFDRFVEYELADDEISYTYKINLRLKNQYRDDLDLAGYTEREWRFNIEIVAESNPSLTKKVEIAFVPQLLMDFRLENYSKLVAETAQDGKVEAEFTSNQPESSLIIPGESGLIKIFAEYDYSYFENITISSSRKEINGKEYFVKYQQMVYNKERNVYESYAGITADGESLTLKKVSYSDGSYEGIIFVRTILDTIVGVRETFTITVNADTYDLDGNVVKVTRSKTLVSQYRPGVYVGVENALTDEVKIGDKLTQVYLVEKDSNVSTIIARVYGYEFNIQPSISINKINASDTEITTSEVAIIQQGAVEKDETGAYVLKYMLGVYTNKPFKVTISMTLLDNGNTLTDKKEELYFYPVPYIINNMYVNGEVNGGLDIAINSSKNLEMVWNTKSTTNSKIEQINNKIYQLDYLKLFYIKQINSNGQNYNKYFTEYLNAEGTSFSIKKNADNTYRIESLLKVDPMTVYFNLWYGYDLTSGAIPTVNFSVERNESLGCTNLLSYQFKLILTMHTTEDAPNPINTASDLLKMSDGENYILMEDITLENWVPLNTKIASLDGNGKIINIKSFSIDAASTVNAGLFGIVDESTILKNIVINIGTMNNNLGTNASVLYISNEEVTTSTINFGLLAGVNNGLIYNCEVVSISSNRTLDISIGAGYKLTFGGLVGVNQGNITNSRVGTEYFQRLEYAGGSVVSSTIRCGQIYLKTKGIVAGFVGENYANAKITSCFVANTSVENTANSGNDAVNRTAGFVATNNGLVAYSYVKGLEKNIVTNKTTTQASVKGGAECVIYSSGAGSVAGFVYTNSGTIHDCYSNTVCKSNSAVVAGFVYDTTAGVLYQCYSASKVIDIDKQENENVNTALATQLPFVGVGIDKGGAQQLLSSKDMLNCYYLDDGTKFDYGYKKGVDVVEPKGLSLESFVNPNNLNNFSFISDSSSEQQLNGVWTYSTAVDKNRSTYPLYTTALPELTSANTISRSLRVYSDVDSVNGEKNYKYPNGYEQGSKNNPYIIRSVEEYQAVFVENAPKTKVQGIDIYYRAGYVRFIDDIDFKVDENEYIDIATRSNYMLGDKNNRTFTLIDGNGMTISNVVINHLNEEEKGNLGLFSEVYNSVIKGLNINYATQTNNNESEVGSTTATFVGGVAGIAKNTYLIDLNLTGGVTLRANNVVGGAVGRLTGEKSGLYNITSSLNVIAGNDGNSNTYENEDSAIAYLSYAGGIAGIVDIGRDGINETSFNVNKLTAEGSSVRANRAGGIAGFMGKNINAKRLTYTLSNNSQVLGREVAGGIVADNYADIELSQASYDVDNQFEYDKQFGKYINDKTSSSINNESNIYGNLNAVTGQQIVGGFAGINYAGNITRSLTKANIGVNTDYGIANTIGGFIGVTYGGKLQQVYAQNYIDLVYTQTDEDQNNHYTYPQFVGGLAGKVEYNAKLEEYLELDNVVIATFFDKHEINLFDAERISLEKDDVQDPTTKEDFETYANNIYLDYVASSVASEIKIVKNIGYTDKTVVNYGVFNADKDKSQYSDGKIKNNVEADDNDQLNIEYFDMNALYNTSTGDDVGITTQQDIFDTLFATWDDLYWVKEYTKFMPNLKLDNSTDYIIIEQASDINKIIQNPDKNFILVKDVDLGTLNQNYVVEPEFTGILIGTKNTDGTYTKFSVTLNASSDIDLGAGFFKKTNGAKIANIGFEYKLNLDGSSKSKSNEYKVVGGISANDENSRFEQVEVTQSGSVETKNNASVATLGSIVGEGKRSKIISCSSNVSYNINASAVSSNIGGLVGYLNGFATEDDEETGEDIILYDGLITSSSYTGDITATSTNGVNIGGIAGYMQYSRISDSAVTTTIQVDSVNNNLIGGVASKYTNASIATSSATLTVKDKTESASPATYSDTIDTTYYVGGLVAEIANDAQTDKSIDDSYSKLIFDITKAKNVYLGGIVANQISNFETCLNNLVSEVTVIENSDGTGTNLINKMVLGGIVAWTSGNITEAGKYVTQINDSMSIIDADIDYASSLIGGGLIGYASGSYSINNSTAMGVIKANNPNSHIQANTSTQTILGGMIGLVAQDEDLSAITINNQINKSYTVLTLSTANVYQGKVTLSTGEQYTHKVLKNAIIGYNASNTKIDGDGVLYSSDYTLALENDYGKFSNKPVNVTANILVYNTNLKTNSTAEASQISSDVNIGDAWKWVDGHLPVPLKVNDLLVKMGILEYLEGATTSTFKEEHNGKAYSPIIIDADTKEFNTGYKYYLLSEDIVLGESKGDLEGVILGNNCEITSSAQLLENIGEHSAVSNITFKLTDEFNGFGAVSKTNNGTIFMCGVQYENPTLDDSFGGLTSENNGTISYCYNSGNTDNTSGELAGLVYENSENASIEYSYFTGSFNGGDAGSGLVSYNSGYIGDSYTAGMAKNIIGADIDSKGRYGNVFYDYYASFVSKSVFETWENKGVIGTNTREMQNATESIFAKSLFKDWAIYSMQGWTANKHETTYNYGYPIHNIEQYTQFGTIQLIPQRVKATGNGTFTLIVNSNGDALTGMTEVLSASKNAGRVVYDETKNKFYHNQAFLINNLGVLDLINTIENTTGLYFELEIDMVMPSNESDLYESDDELLTAWPGIGSENAFAGVFTSSANPKVITPDIEGWTATQMYTTDRTLIGENQVFNNTNPFAKNNSFKTIRNLTGGALFKQVTKGAIIANLKMEDTYVADAALISKVVPYSLTTDIKGYTLHEPVVYNVDIGTTVKKQGKDTDTDIAGLVYDVAQDTTLNLYAIKNKELTIDGNSSGSVAGIIGTNNGTVNITESFSEFALTVANAHSTTVSGFANSNNGSINIVEAINIELNADANESGKVTAVNGFVNTNSGTILSPGSTVTIKPISGTVGSLGGFVGIMTNGTINGFTITFDNGSGKEYITDSFGGVVNTMSGGQLGDNTTTKAGGTDGDAKAVTVKLTTATAKVFGGIIATASGGSIKNVKLEKVSDNITVTNPGGNTDDCSYGLIIGNYTTLNEINYTLSSEINFVVNEGVNVGGIIGCVTGSALFNFTNDQQKVVTVSGAGNVGGFIGKYKADNSLTFVSASKLWPVGADGGSGEYAMVEVACPTSTTTGSATINKSVKNFGGIIGYWDSSATLSCGYGDNSITIINFNPVLKFAGAQGETQMAWFKNTTKSGGYNYIANNIGGVVGLSNGNVVNASNVAQVGVAIEDSNPHETINPIYGSIKASSGVATASAGATSSSESKTSFSETMQFRYVGGVVGCIKLGENSPTTTTSLSINGCSNLGPVYGMYAVGGIIGGATDEVEISSTISGGSSIIESTPETTSTISATASASTTDIIIVGLTDVGGIIGRADKVKIESSNIDSLQVAGLVNVGGLVGSATTIIINSCVVDTNFITGNLNVGGLVGYADAGIFNSNEVSGIVNGSVFDYMEKVQNATKQYEDKFYYFIPTNIGGAVGYVKSPRIKGADGNYEQNQFSAITINAKVTTDEKFKIDDENQATVNMTQNYMPTIADRLDYVQSDIIEKYYVTTTKRYDAVDGGIGGFAGRLDSVTSGETTLVPRFTDSAIGGDVYAPYGINVGSTVGYLKCDPQLVTLPTTPEAGINVAGKIFVGGYIGKSQGMRNYKDSSIAKDNRFDFLSVNPIAKINVQQYIDGNNKNQVLAGYCIGGIIGCITGDAYNINLPANENKTEKSKIKVFNSDGSYLDSSYVGALVGRLDGNMYNCSIAPELCDAVKEGIYYTSDYQNNDVTGIIQYPKVYNYGGLVGLANIGQYNSLNINGTHYYAFTVDMVQNRNYSNGATKYEYSNDNGEGILVANAHYINNTQMTIAPSGLTDLYNNDHYGTDDVFGNNHNPTNVNARGWAKEYTMFRMLARIIDQPNEPTGDSVQVIYNANYVTEVYTSYKKVNPNPEEDEVKDERELSDEIIYTIYQPLNQTAMLYCKYGIATLDDDFNPDEHIKRSNNGAKRKFIYEQHYEVTLQSDKWSQQVVLHDQNNDDGDEFGDIVEGNYYFTNRTAFWRHINKAGDLNVANKYINEDGTFGERIDEEVEEVCKQYQLTFGYTYFNLTGYLGDRSEQPHYFKFNTVFGAYQSSGEGGLSIGSSTSRQLLKLEGGLTPESEEYRNLLEGSNIYSNSGNIFEVSGLAYLPETGSIENDEKWLGWVGMGLTALAFVISNIVTFGGAMTVWVAIGTAALGAFALNCAIEVYAIATYEAELLYTQIDEVSMGYCSSIYSREISWNKNGLDAYNDSVAMIDVKAKVELGATTPSSLSGYQTALKKRIIDNKDGTYTIPMVYMNCTSSRNNPGNINSTITIEDRSLDEDFKNAFNSHGISKITIPRYCKIDDELYCYAGDDEVIRVLHPNYEDVINNSSFGDDIYDVNGYGYILESAVTDASGRILERYSGIIVSAEDEGYLKKTYDIDRVATKSVKASLSASGIGSIRVLTSDEKAGIRWVEASGVDIDDNKFIYSTTFKYCGTYAPTDGYYVTRRVTKVDGNKVTFKNNNADTTLTIDTEVKVGDLLYFSLNGSGESIEVIVKPQKTSKGLTWDDVGLDKGATEMYYHRDNSGTFNVAVRYILSSIGIHGNVDHDEKGVYYTTKVEYVNGDDEIGINPTTTISVYPYTYDKNGNLTFGGAIPVKLEVEDIESYLEVTISDGEEKGYSLSNKAVSLVKHRFMIKDDNLYIKNYYASLRIDDKEYLYYTITSNLSGTSYTCRYVYNTSDIPDVIDVKFYTRFYYGEKEQFFGTAFDRKTIANILIPKNKNTTTFPNVIFSESARITLSVQGSVYTSKTSSIQSTGKITCGAFPPQ